MAKETATAIFAITAANQLLTLKAYNELDPKDQVSYDKAANEFVDAFNNKYPEGKVVKAEIARIIASDRVTFIMKPHKDLSAGAYSFPYEVVDIMAANVGAGNADGLIALQHASLEPLYLTMTVVAVKEGDQYQAGTEMREYKCAAIVRKAGTREEIALSDDASDLLAETHREVLKEQIKEASAASRAKRRSSNRKSEAEATVVAEAEEADV